MHTYVALAHAISMRNLLLYSPFQEHFCPVNLRVCVPTLGPLSGYCLKSLHVDGKGMGSFTVRANANTLTHAYKHLPCERGWRALGSSAEQTR